MTPAFGPDKESAPLSEVSSSSHSLLRIERERIAQHVRAISQFGRGPTREDGYTRAAWSPEEDQAHEYIAQVAKELFGLKAHVDEVGNLFLRTPWGRDKVVQVGSHLDTVPHGGNYDGAAGVIAGLEAIGSIVQSGVSLERDLELVVWRAEESATFAVYAGSRAAFGRNRTDVLEKEYNGQTMAQAIHRKPERSASPIAERRPTLTPEHIKSIAAHLELHIEQAKVLEQEKKDIGIVTSIRGPKRWTVEFDSYDSRATAEVILELNSAAMQADNEGKDIVFTVSQANLPGAPKNSPLRRCNQTSVPGLAEVRVEGKVGVFAMQAAILRAKNECNIKGKVVETQEGYKVLFVGEFDHSGGTPLGKEYRHDANLAASRFVKSLGKRCPEVRCDLNYPVEGRQTLRFDLRSTDPKVQERFQKRAMAIIKSICQKYGTRFRKVGKDDAALPVEELSPRVQDLFEQACKELNLSYRRMVSGAGHDVAVVSKQQRENGPIPTGLIFIPCKKGISHNPKEQTSDEAIQKGAMVLAHTLRSLATRTVKE